MNNMALTVALATAPSSAFTELRERPRFWCPLLLVVVSTAALVYWYYSMVDIEWLKALMFGDSPDMQKLPEAERAQAMAMVGRGTLLWGSVVATLFVLPIVFLVSALYLWLAGKVTKLSPGFKHWFALTCWASLPLLLTNVVAALFLLLSDSGQVSPSALQPLSVNGLVLNRPMGAPGYALFESLTIPGVLSWALMIIGVRTWSQRSWLFSTIFILLPNVLIYGVWAFFAFR